MVRRSSACVARVRFVGMDIGAGGPDEPEQEFVAADQAGGRPGRHHGATGPWDQPWAHSLPASPRCRGQQPPSQGLCGELAPRRVQDHNRRRLHQAINRGRLHPRRHPTLPVRADDLMGVPVGHVRRGAPSNFAVRTACSALAGDLQDARSHPAPSPRRRLTLLHKVHGAGS